MIFVSVSVFFLNLEFAEFQGVLAPWDLATSLAEEEELGPDPRRRASHGARHRRPMRWDGVNGSFGNPTNPSDFLGLIFWERLMGGLHEFLDHFWIFGRKLKSVTSPKRSQGCGSKERLLSEKTFDLAFIMLGTNDLASGEDIKQFTSCNRT